MIAILQNVLGNLIDITRLLNDINHQYLNFVNFTTLNFVHKEFSDEDVVTFTDTITNLAKPIAMLLTMALNLTILKGMLHVRPIHWLLCL